MSRDNIAGAMAQNAMFFKSVEEETVNDEKRIEQIRNRIEKRNAKLAAMMGLQSMLLEATTNEE